MTKVIPKTSPSVLNQNLKQMVPKNAAKAKVTAPENTAKDISGQAKELNANPPQGTQPTDQEALSTAADVSKNLAKLPVIPIVLPKETKKLQDTLHDKPILKDHPKSAPIRKPAVLFIEGFSAFGISNGDGIKDMADNFPGAKRFSWDEKDKIIDVHDVERVAREIHILKIVRHPTII
jgi:predicted RNA methylase